MVSLFYDTARRRLGPLARGYLLWFETRDKPAYSAASGIGLLLIFIVLEFVIGPRASILSWFGVQPPPAWARVVTLLLGGMLAVRLLAGVKLADVGFVAPWRWRAAESLYLAQVVLIAGALFFALRLAQLSPEALAGSWSGLAAGVGTTMLWGFYQEFVYRGVLQTELTRRLGAASGALLANVAFTFGPLHFYHLQDMRSLASAAAMMAAIFAIGLVFAFIYARTRNLWIVGIVHGIGDVFTSGLGVPPA